MKHAIGLHRFALLLSALTLFLLFAGAMVTSTGSGLAVPDWPLSFGQFFPPMVGGVFYEHGHRMIAGTVAVVTLLLSWSLFRWEDRTWVKVLGLFAVVAVLLQALLGGITVLYQLPVAVSISHATLAQIFFSLTVLISIVTSPTWRRIPEVSHGQMGAPLIFFSLALSFAFLLQLVMGATVRHTGAALAIPDFPTVFGGWVPEAGVFRVWIHYFHRVGAFVITLLSMGLASYIYRYYWRVGPLVVFSGVIVSLVCFQVLLGGAVVLLRKPEVLASFHLLVGALCLGASVALTSFVLRYGWKAKPSRPRILFSRTVTVS